MGLEGIYQVSSILSYFEDGPRMISKAEQIEKINSSDADPRTKQQQLLTVNGRLKISDDHKIYPLVPIPEGVPETAIKEAVEAGKIILEADNYCYMGGNVYDWKEENGAFLYDTKQERKVGDTVVSSWDDLKFDGTHISFANGLTIYEKLS